MKVEKLIRENGINRQSAILNEFKGSLVKLSVFDKDEILIKTRQTLLNRTSILPDHKYLEGTSTGLDEDLLVDLISDEVGSWKKDLLKDYIKIAEKAEKELQFADTEKTHLLADKNQLIQNIQSAKNEVRVLRGEYTKIENNLHYYLKEYETQSEQLVRIRENYDQYEKLHTNIEKTLKVQLLKISEESEKKIGDLNDTLQKLISDKTQLLKEKTQVATSQLSIEEFQRYQSDQIAELTLKNSKLALENESMRVRINNLYSENSDYLEEINELKDQMIKVKNNFNLEIEQTTKTYEIKLKQNNSLKNSVSETQLFQRTSDLYCLNIPDHEVEENFERDHDFYERDRTTTDVDKMNLMQDSHATSFNAKKSPTNELLIRNPPDSENGLKNETFNKKKMIDLKDSLIIDEETEFDLRNATDLNFFVG